MFHAAARARYDVALTMYHDQGLIPAKTLAFDDGVNVTLGLPFVRTSPDHGTAFDIAGKGLANPVEPDRGDAAGRAARRADDASAARRPAAAARGRRRARPRRQEIARPEFPVRSQPDAAHRARRADRWPASSSSRSAPAPAA